LEKLQQDIRDIERMLKGLIKSLENGIGSKESRGQGVK